MSSPLTFLTKQLWQPNSLAVILSLSIHGILGASDPEISGFSPKIEQHGKVGVIELTPAQMRRLPQLLPKISPPKLTISPIPAPPNIVPSLPPEPPSIQLPSTPERLSLLPQRQPLPPLNNQPPSNYIPLTPRPNKPLIVITPPPLPSPPQSAL